MALVWVVEGTFVFCQGEQARLLYQDKDIVQTARMTDVGPSRCYRFGLISCAMSTRHFTCTVVMTLVFSALLSMPLLWLWGLLPWPFCGGC